MSRRVVGAVALVALVVGCGLDFVGGAAGGPIDPGDGGEAGVSPDGAPLDGSEYFIDGGMSDAELVRPDAGVPFVPDHIAPVYTLTAGDVSIASTTTTEIDTTARTIKVGGGAAQVSADIVHDGAVAVWSVGTLDVSGTLRVKGDRPLVIVAARDVIVDTFGDIEMAAERTTPAPGGLAATLGPGGGKSGTKTGDDAAGGGGAGHAQIGGKGADQNGQAGGAGGPVTNANGALLVGGSGGGNGGGFVAGGCGGRGQGGGGGGALQISAVGRITVFGNIHLGGGGGRGGCRNNGGDAYTGGGGGGAGGVLFLEAVAGIDITGLVAALGGGGGESGEANGNGNDGDDAPQSAVFVAGGGLGALGGGNGGAGGGAASAPGEGESSNAGGGGGGAAGFVFLRTRGVTPVVTGDIAAIRVDQPF